MAEQIMRIGRLMWLDCLRQLHLRSEGVHESGCFLLGRKDDQNLRADHCVYYDELDRNAYSSGVCVLYADAFECLFALCRNSGLTVIADIHTHPGSARQSHADRQNPMVARAGHIALIVPSYARPPVWRHLLGAYQYRGSHEWTDHSGWGVRRWLRTGTLR